MSPLTLFSARATLNAWFRDTGFTPPETVYLGFLKDGSEISGENYARQPVTFTAPETGAGFERIANAEEIAFPQASGDIETGVNGGGLWTALTGGNLINVFPLSSPFDYLENVRPVYPEGALGIRIPTATGA